MKEVRETKTVYITKYEASDGARFITEQECIDHEATLNAKRSLVESIECTKCWIPFSGWDMEPDESKLYLVRNQEEFEALRDYYNDKYYSESDWWDDTDKYPAAYLVLAREGLTIGYLLSDNTIKFFHQTADLINEYLFKTKQEVVNDGSHN